MIVAPYTRDQALRAMRLRVDPQPARIYGPGELPEGWRSGKPASLAEIRDRGELRVCYQLDDYPAAFWNSAEPPELVGFDIEMAHRFARSLELPLAFLAVSDEGEATERLDAGACDLFATGLAVTPGRTERVSLTTTIYQSSVGLIVHDHERDRFRTWEGIRSAGASFRFAVPSTPARARAGEGAGARGPAPALHGNRRTSRDPRDGSSRRRCDRQLLRGGAAWTLLFPQFTLVVPRPALFVPVAYAVARGNDSLLRAFDAWLLGRQAQGTVDALYRYWMLGEAARIEQPPRWSVIRDVLQWVGEPERPHALR